MLKDFREVNCTLVKYVGFFFFVKFYMTSRFQFSGTGLKEIKNNIFVKLMQDTKAYVHLFKFYVATIAALSSIQFKSKLRT